MQAHPNPELLQAAVARADLQERGIVLPGVDTRLARLMVDNSELRARFDAACVRIADLSRDLRTLKGENAYPQDGSHIARIVAGDSYVLVEYDLQPAEAPVYDLESPLCGPGCAEEITVLNLFVNGAWSDPSDVRAALEDERLIESINNARAE